VRARQTDHLVLLVIAIAAVAIAVAFIWSYR
jgi:hypothetical protein